MFTMSEESSQECVQQYHRRNPADGKSTTPWGKSSLPVNPEPTTVPTTTQLQDNVPKLVCTALSKTTIQVSLLDPIQLTQCQEQVAKHMGLHQVVENKSDPPIMLQSDIIHRYRDAPFYMSLHLGSDILHNCMLDSGVSANVMPLSVMKELGLDVNRPYRNVCGLDSRSMSVHGPIKDIIVCFATSPDISTIMNIVVVDLPPSYGMLLSHKFSTSVNGTIQMDLSFTSILNLEGCLVRIM